MVLVALVGMSPLRGPAVLAIDAAGRRRVAALRGAAPVEEAPAEPETGTTPDEAPVPAPVPRPRYAESDAEKTVILPRIDYGEYGVGPYDAITEVMPAIRDVPGRSNAHGQL